MCSNKTNLATLVKDTLKIFTSFINKQQKCMK